MRVCVYKRASERVWRLHHGGVCVCVMTWRDSCAVMTACVWLRRRGGGAVHRPARAQSVCIAAVRTRAVLRCVCVTRWRSDCSACSTELEGCCDKCLSLIRNTTSRRNHSYVPSIGYLPELVSLSMLPVGAG